MRLSWLDFFSHLGQVGWRFHSILQWLARPNFYSICVGLPLGFFVAVFPLGVAWLVFEVIHPNNSTATVSALLLFAFTFLAVIWGVVIGFAALLGTLKALFSKLKE